MNRRTCGKTVWLFLVLSVCATPLRAGDLVERAKLDALVKPLLDGGWIEGASIALVNESGTQFAGYGRMSEQNPQPPAAETVFEIGSVSKTFTALLLAQMVEQKQFALSDPIQKLVGDSMKVPKFGDREITLVDLATHSSGLPRMPENFSPKDGNNPYADYDARLLGEFLSNYKLTRAPGTRSDYTNLGMGLLGVGLARASGKTYERLIRERIAQPLLMTDTTITLGEAERSRLASGHDCDGVPVANWDLDALAGAGAIRSTAADMAKYVAAQVGLTKTPFDAAIALSHEIHFKNPESANEDVGLAWMIGRRGGVIWHNGQTGGYHSLVAFVPAKSAGVVVLSNTAAACVDGLGMSIGQLLTTGEASPIKLRQHIKIDADALKPFVGNYQLAPQVNVDVTRDGDKLFIQLPGQPMVRVYPESNTDYFCRAVDAQVTFEVNNEGASRQLVIHQNGRDMPAPRQP